MQVGSILAGRYRIDAVLGSGGMSAVYQATQLTLDKPFAVKELEVVIPNPQLREAAVSQFKVEAQILHSLVHPGLPHLYDFFEDDGKYYLVMELIRGATLEAVVNRDPASETQILRWAHELCSVLQYLHTHDPPVIFRDLKPTNIMLNRDGHIKLIDFGIAKVWDAPDLETLTRTGIRGLCSPGFAAPEQYGSGTDARTDVYALGATLYALLTHTVPPPSVELASGRAELIPIQDFRPYVSDHTVQVIGWMMNLSMQDRPQTMLEVMDAFGFNPMQSPLELSPQTESRFWLGENLTQLSSTTGNLSRRRRRPPSWLVAALATALVVLAGLATWKFLPHGSPPADVVKVSVSAQPDDTKLFDNGHFLRYVGHEATPVELQPGHHVLTFAREGYTEQRQELDVGQGTPPVSVTLAAAASDPPGKHHSPTPFRHNDGGSAGPR